MRVQSIGWMLSMMVLLSVPIPSSARRPADPFTGTWELDRSASTGVEATRSQRLTIEATASEERYRSDLVDADGRRQVTDYIAPYDGTDHPSDTIIYEDSAKRQAVPGTVALRRIDAFNRERIWKRDGQVFRVLRRTVTSDGKRLTSRLTEGGGETAAAGPVLVFRRISATARAFSGR